MNIFRKLRAKASRTSRGSGSGSGSEPVPSSPSAPTTNTIAEREPPRAVHISEVNQSPTLLPSIQNPGSETQFMTIMLVNAKDAADYLRLYHLLQRETDYGYEGDPAEDFQTDYFCNGYMYNIHFIPVPDRMGPWASRSGILAIMQHVFLVLTYEASSRESWDGLVAVYEGVRSRRGDEDGVLSPYPFLAVMIVAMVDGDGRSKSEGEGGDEEGFMSVSGLQGEAKAFAAQQNCLFVEVSRRTGRGACNAVGSLVERAHGVRGQYPLNQEGESQRDKRAHVLKALFSP